VERGIKQIGDKGALSILKERRGDKASGKGRKRYDLPQIRIDGLSKEKKHQEGRGADLSARPNYQKNRTEPMEGGAR